VKYKNAKRFKLKLKNLQADNSLRKNYSGSL